MKGIVEASGRVPASALIQRGEGVRHGPVGEPRWVKVDWWMELGGGGEMELGDGGRLVIGGSRQGQKRQMEPGVGGIW